ncbi:840_t:CDS:2, partial [Scutellospora calospora]
KLEFTEMFYLSNYFTQEKDSEKFAKKGKISLYRSVSVKNLLKSLKKEKINLAVSHQEKAVNISPKK